MSTAEKLRIKMQASKDGWTADDLKRLYVGHGFRFREGAKHRVFSHPLHQHLRATAIRDGRVAVGYIQTALDLLERLDAIEKGSGL